MDVFFFCSFVQELRGIPSCFFLSEMGLWLGLVGIICAILLLAFLGVKPWHCICSHLFRYYERDRRAQFTFPLLFECYFKFRNNNVISMLHRCSEIETDLETYRMENWRLSAIGTLHTSDNAVFSDYALVEMKVSLEIEVEINHVLNKFLDDNSHTRWHVIARIDIHSLDINGMILMLV